MKETCGGNKLWPEHIVEFGKMIAIGLHKQPKREFLECTLRPFLEHRGTAPPSLNKKIHSSR